MRTWNLEVLLSHTHSVDLYIYMYALLAPKRLDRFDSNSVFKSVFVMGLCPISINISAPKMRILQMGLQNTNDDFLDKDS
jgi:hypothetical protein